MLYYLKYIATLLLLITFSKSKEKYNLFCSDYLIAQSRTTLYQQVGVREPRGKNGGETLKYQKPFGLKYMPYCAMGQDWCYLINLVEKSDMPYQSSPLALKHFTYAKKKGLRVKYIPAVDDFIVWNIKGTAKGHIERIIRILKYGFVETIGFNTSNGKSGSQRLGNGVFKRIRSVYNPLGLLLIKGLVGIKSKREYKEGCNVK